MPKHDLSRIKVNSSVVDPLAEVDEHTEVDPAVAELRLRYYNPQTSEPISFEQLEKRIRKNADRINRLSVEMMFDLYFAHANWDGFYNRTDSFSAWLERTVDVSRSYAYDIIKVVRTMIAYFSESNTVGEPPRIEELGSRIEQVGLKKMKLISQVRDQDARYDFLRRALAGDSVNDQEILERSRNLLGRVPASATNKLEKINISTDRIKRLAAEYDKQLTEAEAALGDSSSRYAQAHIDRAVSREVLSILHRVCLDTPLEAELKRIKSRHETSE